MVYSETPSRMFQWLTKWTVASESVQGWTCSVCQWGNLLGNSLFGIDTAIESTTFFSPRVSVTSWSPQNFPNILVITLLRTVHYLHGTIHISEGRTLSKNVCSSRARLGSGQSRTEILLRELPCLKQGRRKRKASTLLIPENRLEVSA